MTTIIDDGDTVIVTDARGRRAFFNRSRRQGAGPARLLALALQAVSAWG